MEELQDINFLATIEGQDYEESLRKIVSIAFFLNTQVLIRDRNL